MPVRYKFAISFLVAGIWFFLSAYIARPWIESLSGAIGFVPSIAIILFIALIPGFLNAMLLSSILLDSPPPLRLDVSYPPVSILIAAYNEEKSLPETFRGIAGQDYPNEIEVIVVDDGSEDNTVGVVKSLGYGNVKLVSNDHGGKASALNEGLELVSNDIVVTIDADTFLHPQALRRVVARLITDPPHTGAVAGCVLAKNSRSSFMARMQEWDYFAAITSVKRQQGLYPGNARGPGSFQRF